MSAIGNFFRRLLTIRPIEVLVVLAMIAIIQAITAPEVMRILVLCMDDTSGAQEGSEISRRSFSRSDAMILMEIDSRFDKTTMRHISRDTLVYISPDIGWDKLNLATQSVGPRKTCRLVADLLGCKVDHYVVLTIPDFRELVRITSSGNAKQEQHAAMSKEDQALTAVRARSGSDTERQMKQGEFLQEFFSKARHLSPRQMLKLAMWARNLDTDMSLVQAACFGVLAMGDEKMPAMAPGMPIYLNGYSYVMPIPHKATEHR